MLRVFSSRVRCRWAPGRWSRSRTHRPPRRFVISVDRVSRGRIRFPSIGNAAESLAAATGLGTLDLHRRPDRRDGDSGMVRERRDSSAPLRGIRRRGRGLAAGADGTSGWGVERARRGRGARRNTRRFGQIELRSSKALVPLKHETSGTITRLGGVLSGPLPLALRLLGGRSHPSARSLPPPRSPDRS